MVPNSVVTDITVAVIAGPDPTGARLTLMLLGEIVPDGKLLPVRLTIVTPGSAVPGAVLGWSVTTVEDWGGWAAADGTRDSGAGIRRRTLREELRTTRRQSEIKARRGKVMSRVPPESVNFGRLTSHLGGINRTCRRVGAWALRNL